MLIEGVNVRKN